MKMICISEAGQLMSSEPVNPVDLTTLILGIVLQAYNNVIQEQPEHKQQKTREQLYDMFNDCASAFLEAFAPEIELRPDLTAEAIMLAENQLLEQKVAELETEGQLGFFDESMERLTNTVKLEMVKDGLVPKDKE